MRAAPVSSDDTGRTKTVSTKAQPANLLCEVDHSATIDDQSEVVHDCTQRARARLFAHRVDPVAATELPGGVWASTSRMHLTEAALGALNGTGALFDWPVSIEIE